MYGVTTISVDELGPPVSPSSPWPCGRGATALRERRGRRRSRWPRSAGTPGSRRHKPRAAVDGVLVDACCPGPGPRTVASAQVPEVLVHVDGHANVAWARLVPPGCVDRERTCEERAPIRCAGRLRSVTAATPVGGNCGCRGYAAISVPVPAPGRPAPARATPRRGPCAGPERPAPWSGSAKPQRVAVATTGDFRRGGVCQFANLQRADQHKHEPGLGVVVDWHESGRRYLSMSMVTPTSRGRAPRP